MAWQQFFIQSGGNNAYSGTLSVGQSTPALVWNNTVSWVGGTGGGGNNQFTVTDSAASAIQVGDFINIGGTYVTLVTNISNVGSAYTVVCSTTTAWGTEPATNASIAAYDGGAWLSLAQGILTGSTTVPQSTMVCVKNSVTFTSTVTVALKGATTAPVWFRGYNTSIGDLDAVSATLAYPTMTMNTNGASMTFSGGNTLITGLAFTSSAGSNNNTNTVASTGASNRFDNCIFINQGTTARPFQVSSNSCTCTQCYFACTQSGSTLKLINISSGMSLYLNGCYLDATYNPGALASVSNGTLVMMDCTIIGSTSYAVQINGPFSITNCTFKGSSSDAIQIATAPSTSVLSQIINCAFFNAGRYDINNSSGTNTIQVYLRGNLSYNPTSGHLNGFGDWQEMGTSPAPASPNAAFVDSSQPYVSSTDLHLVASSAGANASLPGIWPQATYVSPPLQSTPDVGAWQRVAGGGACRPSVVHAVPNPSLFQ